MSIYSPSQVQDISYGLNKGRVSIKYAYMNREGAAHWDHIEHQRTEDADIIDTHELTKKGITSYLRELGEPSEIRLIDIGGGVGVSIQPLISELRNHNVKTHYHTVDISPLMAHQSSQNLRAIVESHTTHILDIDGGGIGAEIRTIQSHIPTLVIISGRTLGNFIYPESVIEQIMSGMDTKDRLIIDMHLYRPKDISTLEKQYQTPEVASFIFSTYKHLGMRPSDFDIDIRFEREKSGIYGFLIPRTDLSYSFFDGHTVSLEKGSPIEIVRSGKYEMKEIVSITGERSIASIITDTQRSTAQIMLAP